MPNITEYDAGNIGQSPSDRASSAHATAGRRIAMQYNEAGQAVRDLGHEIGSTIATVGKAYVDYQAHKEISAGGLAASSLALSATAQWEDMTKPGSGVDPNDPTLQRKFLGQIEPQLQQLRESMNTEKGREWADHHINTIREHLVNKTTADMSTLAGVAAHNNATQGLNNLVGTVNKDPSSLSLAAQLWKDQVNDLMNSSPNMKGVQAAKFKTEATQKGMEQLVRMAGEATARNGGDPATISDDPRWSPYVNRSELEEFKRLQLQQQRMAKMEEREAKRFEKEQAQYKSDDTVIAFRKRMGPGADGAPPTREELNRAVDAGELTRRDLEHVLALQDHYAGKEPTDAAKSAANYRPILDQIRNGEMTSLAPIWQAESRGDINKTDSDRLQRAFRDMSTPEGSSLQKTTGMFLKQVRPSIDKSMFGPAFGQGALKFYEFEREVERKVQQYRKDGKDPHDLFDPAKPDYMGKKEVLDKYIPPMERDLRNTMERIQQGNRPPISSFGGN